MYRPCLLYPFIYLYQGRRGGGVGAFLRNIIVEARIQNSGEYRGLDCEQTVSRRHLGYGVFSSGCASRATTRVAFSSSSSSCCAIRRTMELPSESLEQNNQDSCGLMANGSHGSDPGGHSEDDENEDVDLLLKSPSVAQGVRFQQQRVYTDSHQHIKPLVNSQLLQPHHRLSRNSLLSSCKSMDFCYTDER